MLHAAGTDPCPITRPRREGLNAPILVGPHSYLFAAEQSVGHIDVIRNEVMHSNGDDIWHAELTVRVCLIYHRFTDRGTCQRL